MAQCLLCERIFNRFRSIMQMMWLVFPNLQERRPRAYFLIYSRMPLGCVAGIDPRYAAVAEDLKTFLTSDPSYDDGSYGPLFIRLAWHASGTYDQTSRNGGSNGATMRFAPECTDGANAGLDLARKLLSDNIKPKHSWISLADLWILASYVAIECSNGPVIPFRPGRTDVPSEKEASIPPNGRLPDAAIYDKKNVIDHVRQVFTTQMGFSDQETVALIAGGHAYGRCHRDRSGFNGPWTNRPTSFTNIYCVRLSKDKSWTPVEGAANVKQSKCPIAPILGNKQYVNKGGEGDLMMLYTDMALIWDLTFKSFIEQYAKDGGKLKDDFGAVFKKLTELNFPVGGASKI
ncbi:unnamed protein product [Amoebophrya sp. A25]|nr:unnamed protein product [Amoebophrya sp. A25]|eukprot:GSA25T00013364001.1